MDELDGQLDIGYWITLLRNRAKEHNISLSSSDDENELSWQLSGPLSSTRQEQIDDTLWPKPRATCVWGKKRYGCHSLLKLAG